MQTSCTCNSARATREWCQQLPKAELHAHLSGSIRTETIRRLLHLPHNELIRQRAGSFVDTATGRTLKKCFDLFPIIHDLITDAETLREIVLEVLDDFARDRVVYLELRTTPREGGAWGERGYLGIVLETVAEYHQSCPGGMVCRVLVSISRHLPVEEAERTLRVADRFLSTRGSGAELGRLIVGFDLSGNPAKGAWEDFEPVFCRIREQFKLPITLHFGEVFNEEEAMQMLQFRPERVGHAVILSNTVRDRLLNQERDIGIEVCITSNLLTKSVSSVKEHPVITQWISTGRPFCLCTDDSGLFDTTLSEEYGRLVDTVYLSRKEVGGIASMGLSLHFCRDQLVMKRVYNNFNLQSCAECCLEYAHMQ